MKVEVTDSVIWLTADPGNEQERRLLAILNTTGIRVSGRSCTGISICSPELAGLRQIHINRDQQAMLTYALGKIETTQLAFSLLALMTPNSEAFSDAIEITTTIASLLKQLIIHPQFPSLFPVSVSPPNLAVMPRATKLAKDNERKK